MSRSMHAAGLRASAGEMESESPTRILACGAAAGLVHFLVTGFFNAVVFGRELEAWRAGAAGLMHPLAPGPSMVLWAAMSACYGLVGVWFYAGIGERRGRGLGTAALVGIALWGVSKATVALDLLALGLMPGRILASQCFGGLVALVAGLLVGAWLLDRQAGVRG